MCKILYNKFFIAKWLSKCQGRINEVYGIRDQGPKKRVGSGITAPGSGITTPGIGMSGVSIGSRIRRSGSTKFCGIRDQNSHHVWNQGSKVWVKLRDQRWKNIPRYDPEMHNKMIKVVGCIGPLKSVIHVFFYNTLKMPVTIQHCHEVIISSMYILSLLHLMVMIY